jgi:hypothetical protein
VTPRADFPPRSPVRDLLANLRLRHWKFRRFWLGYEKKLGLPFETTLLDFTF